MKVTIAGANSFIGKRILEVTKESENIQISAVVRKGCSFDFSRYENVNQIVECNMEEYGKLGEICDIGDCFIDLSWLGSRGTDRLDSELQKFNYNCNMAAMKSMARAGYTTLISAGSQAEYGLCSEIITEKTLLNPNTEYGKYKVEIFYKTQELCGNYNIRFIEPRYFSLYGPGDYEKTLIMSCIAKCKNGEDIMLNQCTQLWDYLYVDDAIDALLALCKNPDASGAYNFATGEYHMIREFVLEIHKAINSHNNVYFGDFANSFKGQIINLKADVSRLKFAANWMPVTSFSEGIKKIAFSA